MKFKESKYNRTRQDFLLTFFQDSEGYCERELNGFWLVKQWNGNKKEYQVAIYGEDGFREYKKYKNTKRAKF